MSKTSTPSPISFLPVPVAMSRSVRRAFNSVPVSHRSPQFDLAFRESKSLLLRLTGSADVELLLGSGTLANDVVAAQIALLQSPGLILSNGEFGERLLDHGNRHGLSFETIRVAPGSDFDYGELGRRIASGAFRWVWAVHCETFTGTLTDLEALKETCRIHDVLLCMDCISSMGVVPVALDGIYLASAVSGKGIGAYPGIGMVFYSHQPEPGRRLPRYLDLGHYRSKRGIPFTHSWNLMAALREALVAITAKPKHPHIRKESDWLRQELTKAGITVATIPAPSSPAVLTVILPPNISSVRFGQQMEESGFLLSYSSELLIRSNSIRICLMGDTRRHHHRQLLQSLISVYRSESSSGQVFLPEAETT